MAADLTTIHPFPELRAYAEEEERAFYSLNVSIRGTSLGQWARMDDGIKHIVVTARLALLCDLTRPASRDAVCRLVADKLGVRVSAVHQMIEEAKGPLCDVLPHDVVVRIYVTFTDPMTLALVVRHLWPPETP